MIVIGPVTLANRLTWFKLAMEEQAAEAAG
jgi:hypothetical protein